MFVSSNSDTVERLIFVFRSQLAIISAVAEISNQKQLKPRFRTRFLVVDKFKRSGELMVESTSDLVDHSIGVFQRKVPAFMTNLFLGDVRTVHPARCVQPSRWRTETWLEQR